MDKKRITQLTDRYFDGLTSDCEEQELRRLLCTEAANDNCFDEVKAVIGFIEMRKAIAKRQARKVLARRIAVAAAIVLLICGVWSYSVISSENVCIAYVGGEKLTDQTAVMERMKQSIQAVQPTDLDERLSPEAQLKSMFNVSEGDDANDVEVITNNE